MNPMAKYNAINAYNRTYSITSNPMYAYMHKQKGTVIIYFIIIENICYTQSMIFVSLRTIVRPATGL